MVDSTARPPIAAPPVRRAHGDLCVPQLFSRDETEGILVVGSRVTRLRAQG